MSWTRRQFLRGSGVTLALPTLESLLGRSALAQGAPGLNPFRRLISVQMPHGGAGQTSWTGNFSPSLASGWTERLLPYTGSDGTPRQHRFFKAAITSLAQSAGGSLCHAFPQSFSSLYPKMNLIRGIDVATYLGHHSGSVQMGNQWDCDQGRGLGLPLQPMPTIDQIIAYHPQAPASVRRIVNVGSGRLSSGYTNPFAKTGAFVRGSSTTQPLPLFRQIFTTPVTDPRSRTVVDRVFSDYQRLRNSAALSQQDRLKLEAHVEYVQDLSQRIIAFSEDPSIVQSTQQLRAQVDVLPTRGNTLGGARGPEHPGYADDQMLTASSLRAHYECLVDILVVAIRTQHTRLVNFAFDELNRAYDWHNYAHNFQESALAANYRWLHETVLLRLLTALDDPNFMEAGRTVLDNSLVYYMQEHNEVHQLYSIPTALFGSLGGVLRTNQYLDYRDQNIVNANGPSLPGLLVNHLYVSIMQGMGLQPQDYERRVSGIPVVGYGDALDFANNTSGYFQARNCYRYSFAHLADPLPDLFV